ncbi:hypothetical protein BK671_09285 [Pseudomonas fluorescens]|uniref:Uncharacterized protein n=1 Tax=Pseudomonas fluorescens TaxID=294 RepID=A0A423LMW6_PSEFL|nr:hypothetical protein BK671_09285 [Pseudomonas fluorescens]
MFGSVLYGVADQIREHLLQPRTIKLTFNTLNHLYLDISLSMDSSRFIDDSLKCREIVTRKLSFLRSILSHTGTYGSMSFFFTLQANIGDVP